MLLTKYCVRCSKIFHNHSCQTAGSRTWITRKYCSVNCLNKMKIKGIIKECLFCKKEFRTVPSIIKNGRAKYCSKKCWYEQLVFDSQGEKNHEWKGDQVGYFGLHTWINKIKGKPRKCEHCGTTKASRYEWATRTKQYLRDVRDWIRLCKSCHNKFDIILKNSLGINSLYN